jgi:hypothetical protein
VAGGWRRLHNEELHNLYTSPNVVRGIKVRSRWPGHVARVRNMRNAYKILFGKPEGKRRLGRPRCRWKDNIRKNHREMRWRCPCFLTEHLRHEDVLREWRYSSTYSLTSALDGCRKPVAGFCE